MPSKKFMIRWGLILLLLAGASAFYGYGLSRMYHPAIPHAGTN